MASVTTKHRLYDSKDQTMEDLELFGAICGQYKRGTLAKWQHSHKLEDFETSLLVELKNQLSITITDKNTAVFGNERCVGRTGEDIGSWAEKWMISEI